MVLYQQLVGSATPTRSAQQPARPTLHQVLEGQLTEEAICFPSKVRPTASRPAWRHTIRKNRFEFTEALDLGAFVDPSSAQDNPVTGYTLALVLAYVSSARRTPHVHAWTHLSDDASRPCTQREAVEGNFGGAEEGSGRGPAAGAGAVPEELSELVKASWSSPYLAPEPVPPHILKWWAGMK
ncbi:uncharacterized protein ACA1_098890 [Acanthamoeba castellanii str. Neff]|uniref:Uncharacterized protein n=1 Tax=Acanthamoeba castellanii (strain ATCC 30010 / Neff) TaxID=1257118 RepID=L8H5L3_ACACF|nr:uncharacterized protein ACA1_098890 [Acanthamoeba castellanii str. Neff]ELR20512.1 hypothetical protein ACA1_098890 [Acanthamoeba castellanii str. Neff]